MQLDKRNLGKTKTRNSQENNSKDLDRETTNKIHLPTVKETTNRDKDTRTTSPEIADNIRTDNQDLKKQ